MTDKKAAVVANLIKMGNDDFRLAIRWVLGDPSDSKVSQLPKKDDSFRIEVRTRQKNYLQANGTLDVTPYKFEIEPKKYAMVDPPREQVPVPGETELFQRVARKPMTHVAEDDIEETPDANGGTKRKLKQGKGMGVVHLLDETSPKKNVTDAAHIIEQRVVAVSEMLQQKTLLAGFGQNDKARHYFSGKLAQYLVSTGLKPSESLAPVVDLYKSLASMAEVELLSASSVESFGQILVDRAPIAEGLGLLDLDSIADIYEHAAMAMQVMSDRVTLRMLEEVTFTPDQVRKQLKLKALQGGTMIDFWSAPDTLGGDNGDNQRGRHYIASHLLGLGCDIAVPRATVDLIQDEKDANVLEIELTDIADRYGSTKTYLFPWDIDNAKDIGASFSPKPPRRAYVNFDLTRPDSVYPDDSDRKLTADEPRFNTGNGLVEVHIVPEPPSEAPRNSDGTMIDTNERVPTETGFNLYGIWQGAAGMDKYFSDPNAVPELEVLRPYLITRRFSFERDLLGAFPDIKDQTHPGILAALANPPPHAIVPRPIRSRDFNDYEDDGKKQPKPAPEVPDPLYRNIDAPDPTIFTFDLRRGFESIAPVPSGAVSGWDPAAVVDESWSPMKRRDGSTDLAGPEPHRFFVTSVDAFDLESTPVPVNGADIESSLAQQERWIYLPTFRTQVPAPKNPARSIVDDVKSNPKLEVTWEVPDLAEMPGIEALLSQIGEEFTIHVRLYRRRLIEPIKLDAIESFLLSHTDDPNWAGFDSQMTRRGWERFAEQEHPGSAGQCIFELDYADRGYEYVAALNLRVPNEAVPFWTRATLNRKVVYVERGKDGSLTAKDRIVAEAPASSNVAAVPPEVLPNLDEPRGPIGQQVPVVTGQLASASPVLPLHGVQRDLVLAKIIGMKSAQMTNDWRNTGISLSAGQQAAADTALERSLKELRKLPTIPDDLKIDDARLAAARLIVARSFQQPFETNGSKGQMRDVGQNMTIGFRGIMELRWTYESHAARVPQSGSEDAEAVSFDVLQTRAPMEPAEAEKAASFNADGTAGEDGYRLSFSRPSDPGELRGFEELVETLENDLAPKFAVFFETDSDAIHSVIVEKIKFSGDTAEISARPAKDSLGSGKGRLRVFLANPVATVKTENLDSDEPVEQSVLLPVGGGDREYGCWWVVPRSAQGRIGGHARTAIMTRQLDPTIQPLGLSRLEVYSAVDRSVERLDPKDFSDWLPDDIQDLADATSNPRLVLRWVPPKDPDLRLVIQRERRRASQESEQLRTFNADDLEQWRIVRRIEEIDESEELTTDEINKLSTGDNAWMLGAQISVDADETSEKKLLIPPQRALIANAGLLKLPGTDEELPSYIDYWQKIGINAAMDGNFVYRYRLQLARSVVGTDEFLYSAPSAWSEWVLPESPPIKVLDKGIVEKKFTSELFAPRIDFVVNADPALKSYLRTGLAASNAATETALNWRYRILISRPLSILTPGETGSVTSEIKRQVGTSLDLEAVDSGVITDLDVERSFADEDLTLEYEIYVQQFVIRYKDGQLVEQLVRSHTGEPQKRIQIQVPAPGVGDLDKEIHLRTELTVV